MESVVVKDDPFISIDELAKRKGVSVIFLRRAKTNLGLPYYKWGRLLKFKESEFDEWALQRRVN